MTTSLASQTHEGFEMAALLLGDGADLVAQARVATNSPTGDRDRSLGAIVGAYRFGSRQVWGPVLLDLVTPALLQRLKRYRPDPPGIEMEDIRQQLVVELLWAAARMPLSPGSAFVERRLVLRASQGVRRWLAREGRWRAVHRPLEPDLEEES